MRRVALLLLAALLMAGCVQDGTLAAGDVPDAGATPGPDPVGGCALLVSGIATFDGTPNYQQGNVCDLDGTGVRIPPGASAVATVQWTSLQPTLQGRVRAFLESDSCLGANGCELVSASGHSSPLRLALDNVTLQQVAGHHAALRVEAEGIAYQQAFNVTLQVHAKERSAGSMDRVAARPTLLHQILSRPPLA